MILEISNLSFSFGNNSLLKNIELKLESAQRLAIMGANGSGKTSLLRLIVGYYKQYTGDIKYKGQNIKSYRPSLLAKEIAYIPQAVDPFPDTRTDQFFDYLLEADTRQLIELLQIKHLLQHPYKSLSGGEKQRVLLASTLARKPKLIIADELTQAVDQEYSKFFGELLSDYCQQNTAALLIVTHDQSWAEKYCKSIKNLKQRTFLSVVY